MVTATAAETESAVAAAMTVAMAAADNKRNCKGRQQSTKCGRGSNEDSGCGSNHGSAATTAGRVRSAAEVTTIRAAATATSAVVNLIPHFPLGHGERR
jgi:hypothetical protein